MWNQCCAGGGGEGFDKSLLALERRVGKTPFRFADYRDYIFQSFSQESTLVRDHSSTKHTMITLKQHARFFDGLSLFVGTPKNKKLFQTNPHIPHNSLAPHRSAMPHGLPYKFFLTFVTTMCPAGLPELGPEAKHRGLNRALLPKIPSTSFAHCSS